MEDEVLLFIKKHDGMVCLKHIEAEFHYVSKKVVKDAIAVLEFDEKIQKTKGSLRLNGEDFHFFESVKPNDFSSN